MLERTAVGVSELVHGETTHKVTLMSSTPQMCEETNGDSTVFFSVHHSGKKKEKWITFNTTVNQLGITLSSIHCTTPPAFITLHLRQCIIEWTHTDHEAYVPLYACIKT